MSILRYVCLDVHNDTIVTGTSATEIQFQVNPAFSILPNTFPDIVQDGDFQTKMGHIHRMARNR